MQLNNIAARNSEQNVKFVFLQIYEMKKVKVNFSLYYFLYDIF